MKGYETPLSVVRTVRHYLSLGFVPDADIASEYVHQLFGTRTTATADTGELLTEIVADLTAGSTGVAIPLTAGKDSRALLGAALRQFAPRQIHCFTYGPESLNDVRGARLACERVGVSHQLVDPNTIRWDMAEIMREVERRLVGRLGVPPIDGLVVFRGLAEAMPQDLPVLSGFLGDVISGKHLAGNLRDTNLEQALARFIRRNTFILDERPDALFREFLISHEKLKAGWSSLTEYDLLDLGFRQRLRIRGVTTSAFKRVARPYEDARWISHWFSKPVTERIGQRAYDRSLQRCFPALFPTPPLGARVRQWLKDHSSAGTRQRLKSAATGHPAAAPWSAARGDPRQNESMASVLEEACRTFDRRGWCAGVSAIAAFERLMREPSDATFFDVRWFATAEVLARVEESLAQRA